MCICISMHNMCTCTSTSGPGLLALPLAFSRCGWMMGSLLLVLVFSLNYVSLHFLLKACLSAREHSYIGLSGRTSVRALPPGRRHQQRHAIPPQATARPRARTWRAARAARQTLRLSLAGLGGGAR